MREAHESARRVLERGAMLGDVWGWDMSRGGSRVLGGDESRPGDNAGLHRPHVKLLSQFFHAPTPCLLSQFAPICSSGAWGPGRLTQGCGAALTVDIFLCPESSQTP